MFNQNTISGDTVLLIDGNYLQCQLDPNEAIGWKDTLKLDFRAFKLWALEVASGVEDGSFYFDGKPKIDPKVPESNRYEAEEKLVKRKKYHKAWEGSGFVLKLGKMIWDDAPCCKFAPAGTGCGKRIAKQKMVDGMLSSQIFETLFYRPHVRQFVLVAGDSDHLPAMEMAQRAGRSVTLIHGMRHDTAPDLVEAADHHIELSREKMLSSTIARIVESTPPRPFGPRWT